MPDPDLPDRDTDVLPRRLRLVRERTRLSLRSFAESLEREAGYLVSHSTVREYELGGSVPADYVRAVSVAFAADPAWLLDAPDGQPGRDARDDLVEDALHGIAGILEDLIERLIDGSETAERG